MGADLQALANEATFLAITRTFGHLLDRNHSSPHDPIPMMASSLSPGARATALLESVSVPTDPTFSSIGPSSLPRPGQLADRVQGPSAAQRALALDAIRQQSTPYNSEALSSLELSLEDFQAALTR